jgi:DNA-binding winged helix-turn-helix (wHTH) protein/tetratricopeptide (TPR) repeat protein
MHYRFGPFLLDPAAARLSGPDGEIALRPMTLRLLEVLVEHASELQSNQQLLDRVWGRQAVTVGVVAQSVRELRRALGDSVQEPRYIETRHRLGYRFIAEVERIVVPPRVNGATATADTDRETPAGEASVNERRTLVAVERRARPWQILAVIALIAIIAAIVWRFVDHTGGDEFDDLLAEQIVFDARPTDAQAAAAYVEGLRALRAGDLHAARRQLEAALEREPQSVASAAALAEVLAVAGEVTEARRWGEAAMRLSDALPRIDRLRLEGFVAGLEDRWDDAARPLRAVFELQPGDAATGFRLFDAQLASANTDEALHTLEALAALGSPPTDAVRLALARARVATLRGDHAARFEAATQAEALATTLQSRVDALLEQAGAQLMRGNRAESEALVQRIEAMLDESSWPAGSMRVHMLAGTLLREAGDYPAAIERFGTAGTEAIALGQRAVAAASRRESAFVLYLAGRLPEARQALQALEPEVEALGLRRELASTLDVAALVEQRAGTADAARELVTRALALYVDAGDRVGEASARSNLGMHLGRAGRFAEAEVEMQAALTLFRAHGDRRGAAIALGNLAAVFARSARAEAAREANEQALAEFRALEATLDVARLQFNLGLQDRRVGRLADTEGRFREALQGFDQVGAADVRLQVLASLAELLLQRADPDAAQQLLQRAGNLDQAPPLRRGAIDTAGAKLALLRNQLEDAEAGFRSARAHREAAGQPDWVRVSDLDLAELAARRGQLIEAERAALAVRRAFAEAKDPTATHAGLVLAGVRASLGEDVTGLLGELEAELGASGDAALRLRLDLLRATQRVERRNEALLSVATDARAMGFELLALRAELLSDAATASRAIATLRTRGIELDGFPPGLSF